MSEAKVTFTLDGIDLIIQCTPEDKIKDICKKYATKINDNINSLIFLYGGNQMNMELSFKEQANSIDRNNKEMRVLVYKNETEDFVCPKCGEKIKFNMDKINEIILNNNKIKESINGIKFNIENLINISTNNIVSMQLKNINVIINAINEDINKNNNKLKSLLNEVNDMSNKNIIKGVSDIKLNDNSNQNLKNINTQSQMPYYNQIIRHKKLDELDQNFNYEDYPLKIIELINNIRSDPIGYANIIEDSIKYILKITDKNNPSNVRLIFKKKIHIALIRGEPAFREAVEYLRAMNPIPPLQFKKDICIPLPENENEFNDPNFLKEQVKQVRKKTEVDIFFKDLVKIPEISALIMIVDDTAKGAGKKRLILLNKDLKYVGVTSKFIGKNFVAYFSLAK